MSPRYFHSPLSIPLIIAALLFLPVLVAAPATPQGLESAASSSPLQDAINKVKDNLNEDPALFNRYIKETYGLPSTFTLVDKARLDGESLINPAGGSLDLADLKKLPGLAEVQMLKNGGFRLSYAPTGRPAASRGPIDVIVDGPHAVKAADTGLKIDDAEISPTSTMIIRKTPALLSVSGSGSVNIDGKKFDIASTDPNLATTFNYKDGHLSSVTMPPGSKWDYELTFANHHFSPRDASASLYMDKADFDAATGNKILPSESIKFDQDSGTLLIDRFYHFDKGKAAIVRRAFLTGQPTTPIEFSSKGNLVATLGPVDPKTLAQYDSIADLFSHSGYGDGSENKAARRAFFDQYIGRGKTKYRGTAAQNKELLDRIQRGDIPFHTKQGDLTRFFTTPGQDLAGVERIPHTPGARQPAIPIDSTNKNPRLLIPVDRDNTGIFEGPNGAYKKWIDAARAAGRTDQEIQAAFGDFRLPENRRGGPPKDYTEHKGIATHFTTLVPRERITAEGKKAGIATHLEGTHINKDTAFFGNHAIDGGKPLQFGDIAVRAKEYRQLSRQGIKFLYLRFEDAPAQNGWYRMKDTGTGPGGYRGKWVDIWSGVGQQTTINTVNKAFGGKSSLKVRILIPNDPRDQPSR